MLIILLSLLQLLYLLRKYTTQIITFILMYMSVFLVYMAVHYTHARCPQRTEEVIGYLGTEVMNGREQPYRCWQLNLGPLKNNVSLMTGISL